MQLLIMEWTVVLSLGKDLCSGYFQGTIFFLIHFDVCLPSSTTEVGARLIRGKFQRVLVTRVLGFKACDTIVFPNPASQWSQTAHTLLYMGCWCRTSIFKYFLFFSPSNEAAFSPHLLTVSLISLACNFFITLTKGISVLLAIPSHKGALWSPSLFWVLSKRMRHIYCSRMKKFT